MGCQCDGRTHNEDMAASEALSRMARRIQRRYPREAKILRTASEDVIYSFYRDMKEKQEEFVKNSRHSEMASAKDSILRTCEDLKSGSKRERQSPRAGRGTPMSDPFNSRYNPTESGREHSCVKGDTILLGDNKTIQELSEGNHVLGFSGEVKVLEKMVKQFNGEMIRIYGSGILPFDITPDHPLYVVRSKMLHRGMGFSSPSWKKSQELKPKLKWSSGDYLIMPVAKEVYTIDTLDLSPFVLDARQTRVFSVPLNNEIAWLLGMYVAEGCKLPQIPLALFCTQPEGKGNRGQNYGNCQPIHQIF